MKLTETERNLVVESQKVYSAIGGKLRQNSNEVKDKVDLTDLAKGLSQRRDRVLRESEKD